MPADFGITLTTAITTAEPVVPTVVDDDRVHDVVIVGSGPAGYTAAI